MNQALFESLEGRRLLAADPLGTGAPTPSAPHVGRSNGEVVDLPTAGIGLGSTNHFQRSWAFANAFKSAGVSGTGNDRDNLWQTNNGSALPDIDANGYPVGSMPNNVYLQTGILTGGGGHYPAGNWVLQWDGDAELELVHRGKNGTVTERQTDGRLNINVPSGELHNGFYVRIHQNNPNDAVRNIRLWMPGQEGERFHPTFLKRLEPFGVLRMMDWGDTNRSPVTNWDERMQVGDASYAVINQRDTPQGVPYEEMIRLANETNKDLWITVPHRVVDGNLSTADTFVQKLGRLVRYGGRANGEPSNANGDGRVSPPLNSNLNLWIEYSNETWNSGFQSKDANGNFTEDGQYSYTQLKSQQWNVRAPEAHGRLSRDLFETIEESMGGRSRLVRVLAGHANNAYHLQWSSSAVADRDQKGGADALAITHYYGGNKLDTDNKKAQEWVNDRLSKSNPNDNLTSSEKTQFFDRLRDHIDESSIDWANNAGYAQSYGVPLITYEGNQHHDAQGVRGSERHPNLANVLGLLTRDSRQGDAYRYALDTFQGVGGSMPTAFVDVGIWNTAGQWGHLEYQDQPTEDATLYKAFTDWMGDQVDSGVSGFQEGDLIRLESERYSGRWLDGDSSNNVDTSTSNTNKDTLWKLRDEGNGWFLLANQQFYKVLDGNGGSNQNVDLDSSRSIDAVRWKFEPVAGKPGVFNLKNKATGRYLDADGSGASYNVDTNTKPGESDNQWRVVVTNRTVGTSASSSMASFAMPASSTGFSSLFSTTAIGENEPGLVV